jgi:hypothetical protein
MAAVSISDLTSDYLFHARMLYPASSESQRAWLSDQYLAEAEDRSGAEVTSTSYAGNSHAAQFRASNPEERRNALRKAIEEVEATIAGSVASQFAKPFGFRPGGAFNILG